MTLFCFGGVAQAAPETPGPAGQRAYDDLTAMYAEKGKAPDLVGALAQLDGPDAAARKAAGAYWTALFRQAFADETNGRARWIASPFFGSSGQSSAREFRKRAAEQFGAAAKSIEAIDAAMWLVDEEKLPANQVQGMKVLRRLQGEAAVGIYRKLLAPPHHCRDVAIGIIEEVASRKLNALVPEITALRTHYRASIRDAATKAAEAMGLAPLPKGGPQPAISPWLEGELKDIAMMVLTPIPADATWKRFTVTEKARQAGEPPQVREFSGWLLGPDEKNYRVLDLFAREVTLAKADTKLASRSMKEDADFYLQMRSAKGGRDAANDRMNALSERGGLTGQFQAPFVGLPEALIAAWSLARGDKETAATIIFPRLDEAADERFIKMVSRDLLGWKYFDQTLHAFCNERDYLKAGIFAQHLARPIFDGYQYHTRTVELAAQLARRAGEDFKTLTLPTPDQWAQLQKTMPRPRQIEYLATRLRLLNCFQMGQPGGISFDDKQYDRPERGAVLNNAAPKPIEVINPYSELRALKLEIRDLTPLVAFLSDENFLPTYSYWRDFHPGRTTYQVNGLVASMMKDVAKRDLAELATFSRLDATEKKTHLEKISKWIADNAEKTTK